MSKYSELFRLENGKSAAPTFSLITILFLLWGFCNGLIDVLNKHFQSSLQIDKFQSGFVQSANYFAYFLMAIPAGLLARRFGYKAGIIFGLTLIAIGALWFVPAIHIGAYWAFLTGLFILAAGLTCLETIANPYTTILGPADGGATRINLAQSFNGLGWILGPLVGGHFLFGATTATDPNTHAGLIVPYLGIAAVVIVLILVFSAVTIPDLPASGESGAAHDSAAPNATPLLRRPHFTLGVLTQFFYVAAQAGIFGFFINYVLENDPAVTPDQAANWLGVFGFGLFMAGRLVGSAIVSIGQPHRTLAAYAALNAILCGVAIGGGATGYWALLATFFFMSIMFPTIFALGIRGLGKDTKLGSSLIVMSIVGGAIAPPCMGYLADRYEMRTGLLVPLVCFLLITVYGACWRTLYGRSER